MSATRAALIQQATQILQQAGVEDPARDARLLMRWASGLDGAALAGRASEPCPPVERQRYLGGVERRASRQPLSHVTGLRQFWGRDFSVTSDVLDPRPETETLIAEALRLGPFDRILDLGTGSGCILLTLLAEWPGATGTGTDVSPQALEIARGNATCLGIGDRVRFRQSDWLQGLEGRFGLIVSNPPYIAEHEIAALAPEVRDHEPRLALTPGGDGLAAYRAIAEGLGRSLAPQGVAMVEIGPTQASDVTAIFTAVGLRVDPARQDMDDRPRVIIANA